MEKKYKILIVIGVGFFIGVVSWAIATTPSEPPPSEKIEPPTSMTYETNNIVEESNGVKIFELNSAKMIVDAVTQNAELEDIQGKFYQADGTFIELTAERGNYHQKSGKVHVEGKVIVTDSKGAKLFSDKLDWDSKKEILTAKDNVKISKDDMRAYGDLATATKGLRHFKLKGHARVLRGVKEAEE